MSRRGYNSAAPRPRLDEQAESIVEQAMEFDPDAIPALEERLDRDVYEARQEGREYLHGVDLSALPGTTFDSTATPQNAFSPELAAMIEAFLVSRERQQVARAHEAAQTGENLAAMESRLTTEAKIASEKRYGVMVQPMEQDEVAIRAWIDLVEFTIPVGVWIENMIHGTLH